MVTPNSSGKLGVKTLKCLDVLWSWIVGVHTKAIKPFSREPQIYSNLPQNSPTANPGGSAAPAAFIQGREEAGAGAGPSSGYPRTSLVLMASSAWALPEHWAFWPSHISLGLYLCWRLLILQNMGKLFEILEVFRGWETSGRKLVPTHVGQCKEEILMLFKPNFSFFGYVYVFHVLPSTRACRDQHWQLLWHGRPMSHLPLESITCRHTRPDTFPPPFHISRDYLCFPCTHRPGTTAVPIQSLCSPIAHELTPSWAGSFGISLLCWAVFTKCIESLPS